MAGVEGQEVGPYRLVRRLGRGGFADVWLAVRAGPGGFRREVALKLVVAGDADGDGMRADSLLREARLVSWLDDPTIVAVEAADTQDDLVWMAMDYCDGGAVTDLVRRLARHRLPMPPAVAVRIGRDVARALSAAHHARTPDGQPLCVVHRDLKPGNVLLTRSGETKVCDFGIAKATDETNVTGTGLLKGTAPYVAPELWEDVRAFSPASDAFALGTLLVELVGMERLHAGGAMPLVYRRIAEGTAEEDAERVRAYLPGVVPILVDLLQRDPARRLADLRIAADRLDLLLQSLPSPSDPGLLLRVLDHLEGREDAPRDLPSQVGQAWHTILKRALGVDLPLVPGPGGEGRVWALATGPEVDESGPIPVPATGFGAHIAPPAEGPLEELDPDPSDVVGHRAPATLAWPAPPALAAAAPTTASQPAAAPRPDAGLAGGLAVEPPRPPPGAVTVPDAPPLPTPEPRRDRGADDQTLRGTRSPSGRRARRHPARPKTPRSLVLLAAALFAVLGVLLLAIATQRSSAERPASSLLPDAEPPRAADAAAPEPTVAAIAAVEPEALPPSPAPPASAPDRSDDRPARGAAAPRGATGEPPGRAAPSPDQAAAEPVAAPSGNAVLEATAEPTEATPPPAAAVVEASPPCLVLTSRPSGAFVWIDGAPRGSRARSRPEAAGRVTPGEHRIGMSLVEGEAQAEARAVLRAGAGTLVHCDLMGTPTCRVSSAAAALCAP